MVSTHLDALRDLSESPFLASQSFCKCQLCARPTQPGIKAAAVWPQPLSWPHHTLAAGPCPKLQLHCAAPPHRYHLSPGYTFLCTSSCLQSPWPCCCRAGTFRSLPQAAHPPQGWTWPSPLGTPRPPVLRGPGCFHPKLSTLSFCSDALQGAQQTTGHTMFYFVFITCWDNNIGCFILFSHTRSSKTVVYLLRRRHFRLRWSVAMCGSWLP